MLLPSTGVCNSRGKRGDTPPAPVYPPSLFYIRRPAVCIPLYSPLLAHPPLCIPCRLLVLLRSSAACCVAHHRCVRHRAPVLAVIVRLEEQGLRPTVECCLPLEEAARACVRLAPRGGHPGYDELVARDKFVCVDNGSRVTESGGEARCGCNRGVDVQGFKGRWGLSLLLVER